VEGKMALPTGILKNAKTGRFHPILFRPAPLPSTSEEDKVIRYKSQGHHTEGFKTLEAACEWIRAKESLHDTGLVWNWNGEDVPAMTEYFPKTFSQ
jgi:hypothetical protein